MATFVFIDTTKLARDRPDVKIEWKKKGFGLKFSEWNFGILLICHSTLIS